jgi:hypothetical protein
MADVAPHKLTSNTTPAPYVASSSSEYSASYSAWHAFDTFPNTSGFWAANGVPTGWIQIRLGKSEIVTSYGLAHNEAARCPRDFTLQGSNDGKSWRILDRRVGEKNWTSAQRIYQVRTPDRFLYYRIDITANNGDGLVAIGEIYLCSDLAPRSNRFLGSETPTTLPPRVDAGPDQYLYLNAPYVAALVGSSPDTVTFLWEKVWGPGTATFDDNTDATTNVTFSTVGIYGLRLTADDGSLTNSRIVTLTVTQQATTRVSQGPVETLLTETTVTGRVSQGPVEVLMTDDANPARVSQVVAEALQRQTASVRVSQVVAELLAPVVVSTRVSQLIVELLTITVIESRVTQVIAELLDAGVHPIRVSQIVVELLGKSSTYCGIPTLSPAALCGKPDVLAWLEWTVPMKEN